MFEIKNLSRIYGTEYALRDISLTIGKGLTYIIGSSGSGKSTLLKILAGMDTEYEGDVQFGGQNLKALTSNEKSRYFNQVFGFIWQDFNLLEDLTVLENVLLPNYLGGKPDTKKALSILKSLKIQNLANKKVRLLSGGQKQRAAIARELMKDPEVILADEPTSALDEKSSTEIIGILKTLSKNRTVIVVTHDTSLIGHGTQVCELDKGSLISVPELAPETKDKKKRVPYFPAPRRLSLGNAFAIAATNLKRRPERAAITAATLIVSAFLLLVSLSGTISDSSQGVFKKLFESYGDSLLDVNLAAGFIGAGGTQGSSSDQPDIDVTQDISGLYEQYKEDPRVEFALHLQPFNDIRITVDQVEYDVQTSNSVPQMNRLLTGSMPQSSGNEVVISEDFLEKLGVSAEEALGKTITFQGSIYNWSSGEPVKVPVQTEAVISGIADCTVVSEYEGQFYEYPISDSFFFSFDTLKDLREQAGLTADSINFTLRAKTPADFISLKDELNASGIVPLGRFELVEDIVRLNSQSRSLSGSAVLILGLLAVLLVLAVSLLTAILRKRDYAVYKISGYDNTHIAAVSGAETAVSCVLGGILFLLTSPLLSLVSKVMFGTGILSGRLLLLGVLIVFAAGALTLPGTLLTGIRTNVILCLKTGEKS